VEGGQFSSNRAGLGASIFNLDTSVLAVKNVVYPAGSISGIFKE
jgi:hypothetical protein